MTLAIIATIALLYAFCIAVGVLFTGFAAEGIRIGATIATGVVVLVAGIVGVGHLWNIA